MKWNLFSLTVGCIALALVLITYRLAQAQPNAVPPTEDAAVEVWEEYDPDEPRFVGVYDIRSIILYPVNYGSAPHGHVGQFSGPVLINAETDEPAIIEIEELTRHEYVNQIIEMIWDTVGVPDEWLDEVSSVREYRGSLIVRTTEANHQALTDLLAALSTHQQRMISTDAVVLRLPARETTQILKDLDISSQYLTASEADRLITAAADHESISVVATGRQVLMNGQRAYVATQDFIKPPRPVNENDALKFISQINAADDPWTHVFVSDIQAVTSGDAASIHLYARHTLALPNNTDAERIMRYAWRSNLVINPGDAVLQTAALIMDEDGDVNDYLLLLRVGIAGSDK